MTTPEPMPLARRAVLADLARRCAEVGDTETLAVLAARGITPDGPPPPPVRHAEPEPTSNPGRDAGLKFWHYRAQLAAAAAEARAAATPDSEPSSPGGIGQGDHRGGHEYADFGGLGPDDVSRLVMRHNARQQQVRHY